MIQEIAPYKFNNQYQLRTPTAESSVLCYDENKVLIKKNTDGTIGLPAFKDLEAKNAGIDKDLTYLFSIDDRTFYLADVGKPHDGFIWETITNTMKLRPRHLAFAAVTGYQLFNWYKNRKYCGRCGELLCKDEKTRSLSCLSCGQVEYPKIAPAVIIGVTNGSKLLLASYPNYEKYALLAGFVEIGESLEETVKREVMEEVGLTVKNIRYYKSQPWPVVDNLLAGFFCEVDGSDNINFDTEELAGAAWFERQHIPLIDEHTDGSLTFDMMKHFKESNN